MLVGVAGIHRRCTPTSGRDKTSARPRSSRSRVQSVAGRSTPPRCPRAPAHPCQAQAQGRPLPSLLAPCSPPLVRPCLPLPVLLEARLRRDLSRRSVPRPPHTPPLTPPQAHSPRERAAGQSPPSPPSPLTPRQVHPRKHRAAPCKNHPDERSHTPARGRPRRQVPR